MTGAGYDVLSPLKLHSWAEATEKRSVEVKVVAAMRRRDAILTVRGMTSGKGEEYKCLTRVVGDKQIWRWRNNMDMGDWNWVSEDEGVNREREMGIC